MSEPDGERVTTGSEPTVAEVVAAVFDLLPAFMSPRPSKEYTTRMVEERFSARGSGHDEQTEARKNIERMRELADEVARLNAQIHGPWQPDPSTVAAVVEALRDHSSFASDYPDTHLKTAATFIEERFKPSAPGGDDGH